MIPPPSVLTAPSEASTPLPVLRWCDAISLRPLGGATEESVVEALRARSHERSATAAEYMARTAARLFEVRGSRISATKAVHFVRDLVLAGELVAAWDTGAGISRITPNDYTTARVVTLGYEHSRNLLPESPRGRAASASEE